MCMHMHMCWHAYACVCVTFVQEEVTDMRMLLIDLFLLTQPSYASDVLKFAFQVSNICDKWSIVETLAVAGMIFSHKTLYGIRRTLLSIVLEL